MARANIYTLQAEVDVSTACIINEMKYRASMAPSCIPGELELYDAIEAIVLSRIPKELRELMDREEIYKRSHEILAEAGFNTWMLLGLRKRRKK